MYSGKTNLALCEALSRKDNANGKYTVCTLMIEATRRCNIACAHCMKGDIENLDISDKSIDSIMSQIGIIYYLVIGGGEVTLAPDRLRYILESAKRHDTKIAMVFITTNGIIKSQEFLDIYEEYKQYVVVPDMCKIIISNDIYHTAESRFIKKDYQDRKRFYENNGKNHVIFQDVVAEYGLKRCGRCQAPRVNVFEYRSDPEYIHKLQAKYRMYYMATENHLMKRPLRGTGKHICQMNITAKGYILTTDIISYQDEDSAEFYNGHVSEDLHEIFDREKNDPYMQTIGAFVRALEDMYSIGQRMQSLAGVFGLRAVNNFSQIKELILAMKEILNIAIDLIPQVKQTDFYNAHPSYFDIAIQGIENLDLTMFEKINEAEELLSKMRLQ